MERKDLDPNNGNKNKMFSYTLQESNQTLIIEKSQVRNLPCQLKVVKCSNIQGNQIAFPHFPQKLPLTTFLIFQSSLQVSLPIK